MAEAESQPIFHITHWKAGSIWVQAVLRHIAPERYVRPKPRHGHLIDEPIRRDGIYTPVYLGKKRFLELVGDVPHRRVVVIRDLRDTLVSWYFSIRYSHQANAFVAQQRAHIEGMEKDEALEFLAGDLLVPMVEMQVSWLGGDDLIVRYEEMVADEGAAFQRIFAHLHLEVAERRRQRVVDAYSFQRATGRAPGQEEVGHHLRKGVPGDWRNHFSPRLMRLFKERYGQVLMQTGYESSVEW
jgi:hypothetical protein